MRMAFYETRSPNIGHATANAAMIGALLHAYEGVLHFYGAGEHIEGVRPVLEQHGMMERVRFHTVAVLDPDAAWRQRLGVMHRVLNSAREEGCELMVAADPILGKNSLVVLAARALYGHGLKTMITYHGALGKIVGRAGSSQPASRVTLAALVLSGLTMPVGVVVFSPHIAELVASDHPRLGRHLHGVDLPYYMSDVPAAPLGWGDDDPVKFGMVGGNRWLVKGYDTFVELANGVGGAAFYLAGPYTVHDYIDDEKVIHEPSGAEFMSFEAYAALIGKIDYAVFTYRPDKYTYSASAGLLDAFSYGKPVIALANPLFEHVFARFGDIGHLCRTVEEMRETMQHIAETKPVERYQAQQARVLEVREAFSVREVGRQLTGIVDGL